MPYFFLVFLFSVSVAAEVDCGQLRSETTKLLLSSRNNEVFKPENLRLAQKIMDQMVLYNSKEDYQSILRSNDVLKLLQLNIHCLFVKDLERFLHKYIQSAAQLNLSNENQKLLKHRVIKIIKHLMQKRPGADALNLAYNTLLDLGDMGLIEKEHADFLLTQQQRHQSSLDQKKKKLLESLSNNKKSTDQIKKIRFEYHKTDIQQSLSLFTKLASRLKF